MKTTLFVFLFGLFCFVGRISTQIPLPKTYWYQQTVDHFNFESTSATFAQRYLVVDQYLQPNSPLFFYTGNEGPIDSFYNNSGFVFELGAKLNALIVFAEHRYYGQSLPFGQNSWQKNNIGYLSVEQALADYAILIPYIKQKWGIDDAPVISFGGSYGGMLSGWIRIQYPNIVDGALAASAPIPLTETHVLSPGYFDTVTKDLAQGDASCPDLVRQGFSQIYNLASQGHDGLKTITQAFSLCKDLEHHDVQHLILWITNSLGSMAMMNYPYPTNFLAPLPGYPMRYACSLLKQSSNVLNGLASASGLFYNGTAGSLSCFDIFSEFIFCADQTGCGTGTDGMSWDYQVCTEIVYYITTNNVTDMFPPRNWTLSDLTSYCQQTWGVTPRLDWMTTQFGGASPVQASNILFSNGLLDPWYGGGFHQNMTNDVVAVTIADGAHHLDLRGSNPADPPSVLQARKVEETFIRKWISQARKNQNSKTK